VIIQIYKISGNSFLIIISLNRCFFRLLIYIWPGMQLIKKNIPIFIILVFHVVGFVGFLFSPSYFRALSPVNLMLSAGLVLLMSNQTKWQFWALLIVTGLAGFLIEVAGVKTGLIFGTYHYGNSLGFRLFSVPLLIGLNWAVLVYCTSQVLVIKNRIASALLGALLMVGLDFLMEHSAAKLDFWYWKNSVIPLQNYVAWFLISFGLNLLVQKHFSGKPNLTARAFYIIQFVFFAALYFFL
jgi:putative membrane protein